MQRTLQALFSVMRPGQAQDMERRSAPWLQKWYGQPPGMSGIGVSREPLPLVVALSLEPLHSRGPAGSALECGGAIGGHSHTQT
jgi:hypothetical protein